MFYKINDFSYDASNGLVTRGEDEFRLTKIQKKLFDYFIEHSKTVISKQTLMDEVWGRTVTENSIEKTLSKLRNVVETDAVNPKVLVTHFGQGISFEGKLESIGEMQESSLLEQTLVESKNKWWLSAIIFGILLLIVGIYYFKSEDVAGKENATQIQKLNKNQHLLLLPLTIKDGDEVENEVNELIKTTIENSNNTKQVLFVDKGLDNKQAFEKYWQIDKDLVMLQTNVSKNGDIYDAVIALSKGSKPFKQIQISASSLEEVVKAQIDFISNYHKGFSLKQLDVNTVDVSTPAYLEAIKALENKDFEQATRLLKEYLSTHDSNHVARFLYAKALHFNTECELSLAQINALKSTPFYSDNSAIIEYFVATNLACLNKKQEAINDIREYFRDNTQVKAFNKGRLKILLADYLLQLGNSKEALKYYKQAIVNVDDKINPKIYAVSYYGQAQIAGNSSNDDTVYELYEKSLAYAKAAQDIGIEITVLQAMSNVLMFNNKWQEGIALKKESIALMELSDNPTDAVQIAADLGQLVAFLQERGLFSEAADVLKRINKIVKQTDKDYVKMIYNHYNISQEMNFFKYDYCQKEIDKQMELTREKKNYSMLLNAIFLQMELLLAREDVENFKPIWDKYNKLFQNPGLQRYQIYMNLYLARHYQASKENTKAIALIAQVSEESLASHDYKFYTQAQDVLARVYLEQNPQKALDILENIEQYNPNPNPHLEIKARALKLLGRKVEALAVMINAKEAYNEAWKAENQALLDELQQSI